jgi:hypothetical protein
MKAILTTAERMRRHNRDRRTHRVRHLSRRSYGRHTEYLTVLPHIFLAPGTYRVCALKREREDLIERIGGQAVWTLDTAVRLACGRGLLVQRDLSGYASAAALDSWVSAGLVDAPVLRPISLDPVLPRPERLIIHLIEEPPASFATARDRQVVTWDLLVRDIIGTLGLRMDLLAALESDYPGSPSRSVVHAAAPVAMF